jgi:hypothetical protein
MNNKIPQHIDPRELKPAPPDQDMYRQIALWKERGETPFVLVRRAYKHLVQGNNITALHWLNEAWRYVGVFYKPGSLKDKHFKDQLIAQNYNFLMLIDEFSKLRPEEE